MTLTRLYKRVGAILLIAILLLSIGAVFPVVAQDGIDTSNLEISGISTVSEATTGEEIEISSTASIPSLPADWSAQLDFHLYADGEQVTTQTVSLEDGDSIDVVMSHSFEQTGEKKCTSKLKEN